MNLYKEAKHKDNAIAQIYIANAYYAMRRGKDSAKNFNSLTPQDLESYMFARDAKDYLGGVESEINPGYDDLTYRERCRIKNDTFAKAVNQGNTFAQAVLIMNDYRMSVSNFATACRLKPLIQKNNNPELLYYYGKALFGAGLYNEQLEFEGLASMAKSGKLKIVYMNEEKVPFGVRNFSDYCSYYVRYEECSCSYYDRYGMLFTTNGTVVAPSKEHWNKFKKERLDVHVPTPDEAFKVCEAHDLTRIALLKEKYKISFVPQYTRLTMYIKKWGNSNDIGEINATVNNGVITAANAIKLSNNRKDLLPAVAFAEDIMKRCADAGSVQSMFSALKSTENAAALEEDQEIGDCSICLEEMEYPSYNVPRELECGHVFHDACIRQAAEINPTCPLCRSNITSSDLW